MSCFSVPKDVDVNMPSILVISLLERSCLNDNILGGLAGSFSNADFFACNEKKVKVFKAPSNSSWVNTDICILTGPGGQ